MDLEDWEGVLKIVRCMQSWRLHEEVQEKGCMEISNLCVNQYHKELLREAGAAEAVLEAMLHYPESLKVQSAGCQAIAHLASDDKSRIRLCKSGAGTVLVRCLTQLSKQRGAYSNVDNSFHMRCTELRSVCVMAIAHLIQIEENMVPLLDCGAWNAVIQCMHHFPDDDELQLWGCRVLATLAEGHRNRKAEVMACDVVLAASARVMNKLIAVKHMGGPLLPTSPLVRGGWLTSCAIAGLASMSQENTAWLVTGHACRTIPAIMAVCNDELVQEWGTRALAEIALSVKESQNHIRADRGLQAILEAMSQHPSNPRVQFAGCYAIANAATESQENQLAFLELQASKVITQALEVFPTDANIQEWGCRAFAELGADCAFNQLAILQANGCPALVAALSNFPHKPRVQFAACYAIAALASGNAGTRKRLGEAGACRQIERGMTACAADPNVLEWACRALGDLAFENVHNQNLIRCTGGCRRIIQALAQYPHNARVQLAGCYAITYLAAGNRSNQIHFGETDTCERVVQAIIDFATKEPKVKMWGQRAVISLAVEGNVGPKLRDAKRLLDMVKILKDDSNASMAATEMSGMKRMMIV